MIILMLFIRRNLRLKTLQMLQNGLIILTIVSLMRMVNFSHDSMISVMTLISLWIFHTWVVIFQNPLHMVFLFHSWYIMLGFVRNITIFCSEDLFWFQSYWSRDILHGNFRLLFGNAMVVIQTLLTNLTPLCRICWRVGSPTVTYDWFPVILRKSCLWGDFTHSLYIHYRMWFFAWISLDCFVVDLFYSEY